jgi:hypothetical protein
MFRHAEGGVTSMKKLVAVTAFALAALVLTGTTSASADDEKDLEPGGKGTCTAMRMNGTVIAVERAPAKRLGFDYVACRRALLPRVTPVICASGKGSQPYMYKIGANSPYKTSMRCE